MDGNLSIHSSVNDLLRLKKSLQLIREVVRSYEIGLYDHVGFSCAIAISKAEELESAVWRFSPIRQIFANLITALKELYQKRTGGEAAIQAIGKIHSYFSLDRYELITKQAPSVNQ